MVTCSHCNKELDRLAFCNSAHKMAYHRLQPVTDGNIPVTLSNEVEVPSIEKRVVEKTTDAKLCKHSFKIGLCKFGCKK